MKTIEIPFREDMASLSLLGLKTATTRNKKYGDRGDLFLIAGKRFELTRVTRQYLVTVAMARFRQEGFDCPEAFMDVWVELHPLKGWTPHERVWFHEYKKVSQ